MENKYLVTLYDGEKQERQFEMSQGELSVHFPVQILAMKMSGCRACEIADRTGATVIERLEGNESL